MTFIISALSDKLLHKKPERKEEVEAKKDVYEILQYLA